MLSLDQFGAPVVTTQSASPYDNSHELIVTLPLVERRQRATPITGVQLPIQRLHWMLITSQHMPANGATLCASNARSKIINDRKRNTESYF